MTFLAHTPSPPLSDFVASIWLNEGPAARKSA
jgi:hypothetical protein